jgi:NDP-sugar pyrophosphorylase family protein
MHTVALLMAGGRGERMRASGVLVPKPLVEVAGATVLERNLVALLRAGLREIVVSAPAAEPEIGAVTLERGRALCEAAGVGLSLLVEDEPLGNIGCARQLAGRTDEVLVTYADNLTTLDLRLVLAHHRTSGAALTLAAHEEPLRLPYGELEVVRGEVVAYREKPEWRPLVCSAVSVLGPAALEVPRADAPTGLVDLFRGVRRNGGLVVAFSHTAPWVDVNDAAAIRRADELVAIHRAGFEQWWDEGVRVAPRRLGPSSGSDGEMGDLLLDDVDDQGPVRWAFQLADVHAALTGPGTPNASELDAAARRAAFHARYADRGTA